MLKLGLEAEIALPGEAVNAKVGLMPKTEQVRIPLDLVADARVIASAFGESMPAYVARVVRAAVQRDFPRAAKIVSQRAKQAGDHTQEAE